MTPSNQQQVALDVFWNPEHLLIKARAGAGKGLREDQPVVTPSGFVQINQLKTGDLVCGTDGLSYPVTGIYDRGLLPLFDVKFNDGQSVITDGDHRWLCQTKYERDHKKGYVIRTTSDLVDLGNKVFLPMPKPIEGVDQELPIDPWLLGALLGDGGISSDSGVIFSNHEQRMIDAVRNSLPEGSRISFNGGVDWQIYGNGFSKSSNNKVLKALRELCLQGCGSHQKFVPEVYLTSPVDVRLLVLQGLLDTDGSAHSRTLEFSTSSRQLSIDVRRLIESLGGLCSIQERGSYYIKDGIKKNCKTSYRLHLRMPPEFYPFLNCSHKIERYQPKTKYLPVRQIVCVSQSKYGRSICIQVGSPDQLFLTVGHAVTHNTSLNELGCRSNASAKIVNLSFNASVKDEAKKRMPPNVACKTFHGLAWPTHGFKYKHRLKWRFQAKRYAERFGVDPMIVHAARATIQRFNSSADMLIDRWHVPKETWHAKPRAEQDGFRDEVVIAARKLWMMKRNLRDREMPVDFNDIRTMFRLDGCPGIGRYDKVVVDESQDITPCDAAMIARIGAPVVYTGDDCQQLYSWLGSIQNLDEMASVHKYLTESWRFGPAVADAANKVLSLLKLNAPPLVGLGGPSKLSLDPPSGRHTVLCRTNTGLLAEALDAVRKGRSIHVVGNLMESTSLLESGYHLSIGDRNKVTHPSLLAIADWNEVEQLKEHDPDLSVLWNQVEKYGSQIPHFCEELREAGEMPAHKADVIISTVHKAKGAQWSEVKLSSIDFPKLVSYSEKDRRHKVKRFEVYIYYVAVTRAINVLYPNDTYFQLDDWLELLS